MFTQTRRRLVIINATVLFAIVLTAGTAIYLSMRHSLTDMVDGQLVQLITRDEREREFAASRDALPQGYQGGIFHLVLSADGHILDNPQQVSLAGLPPVPPFSSLPAFATVTIGSEPARVYYTQGAADSNGPVVFAVGESFSQQERALQRLLIILVAGGIAGLLVSILAAWFLAARALVPIQIAFDQQRTFVADASHELRTPLTVVRAAADLLYQRRDRPFSDNARLLDDIRHEISRLERLATELLTLARSDLEQMSLTVGVVDLADLGQDIARLVGPLASEHGLELVCETPPSGPFVEGDVHRLQQAILALIDNAIKHTPAGGKVTLRVQPHPGYATLQVEDTGEGIPPEHLDRVFDRFYRVDAARVRTEGGTGLGLAIAHSLVRAHHGELVLTSKEAAGTTATIRLSTVANERSTGNRVTHIAARVVQWARR